MPSTSIVPPWLAAIIDAALIPFELSHAPISWMVTIFGVVAAAISSASWTWSKWPCVMSIRSHRSTVFSFSGATGLFITQGSMRTSLRLALRTFQVPCPIHVKLTSAFSGIRDPPQNESRSPEKPILPQAQNEDADPGERPEVGEEQVAWLAHETEQEDAEQCERHDPAALDRADREEKDQWQQGQPLIRPHLVRYERAEGKAQCHAVRRIPSAAPRRPHRPGREHDRAQIGESDRHAHEVDRRGHRDVAVERRLLVCLAADRAREQRPDRVIRAVGVVRCER